ncbi:hypothetical protein [Streptococcus sinensis]|uniref:hypothetical protein n=1 Tax=Streptococcus sinensis TaxID=176090 RepID=UPI00272B25FB|nr:hypothetical protein [Streptococcus sinensis]
MSDASLRAQIYSDKAKREKYKRVRSSIQSHGLDSDIDVSRYEYYVELCEKAITKIDGNEGYHYLSNLKAKLESDKKTIREYTDFVKDANSAFKDLYVTLGQKISALDSAISSNIAAYNKGKKWWEQIWW